MKSSRREPRPPDRRVHRTRRSLHDALIQLVLERGWDRVSVQEVCARADVGRSTFYVHFADKEELLISGFGDLREALSAASGTGERRPLGFVSALLEHAMGYQSVSRALRGKRIAQVVQRAFTDVVIGLVEEEVARLAPPGRPREIAVRYVAGGFWTVFQWWGEQRIRPTAQEMDELFRRLTLPVFEELSARGATPPA